MPDREDLPYRAGLDEYHRQAAELFAALKSGDDAAAWRFKWNHPRFRGKSVDDVRAAALDETDAQTVIAQEYSFQTWADLAAFTQEVGRGGAVAQFEAAADAVVSGDVAALRDMLARDSGLVRARSTRRHHATLLHYVGANGVEGGRQKTPPNAVEVTKILLDTGAEPDALADLYDHKCTTMSMLVSSCHPANAGLQIKLAETLLDAGAALNGPGSAWQSAVMTALIFGYDGTAQALARRDGPPVKLAEAAGLGRKYDAARLLPTAEARDRHIALALAAQHGHADIVRILLDAGEDPNRYNPDGFHSHSTPLHQAALAGHFGVVRVLVEGGARLDIRDRIYDGTPLGWADHGRQNEIAEYLKQRDSQGRTP
jgi:hypothetical protein